MQIVLPVLAHEVGDAANERGWRSRWYDEVTGVVAGWSPSNEQYAIGLQAATVEFLHNWFAAVYW